MPEIDEAAIHRMTAIQPPALSRENTSKWTVGEVDPGGGRRRENLDGFGEAYWQTPPLQTPPVHPVPFGAGECTHPTVGKQLSSVHSWVSKQIGGSPGTQPTPGLQLSIPLQTSPSLQMSGMPGTHPVGGMQV